MKTIVIACSMAVGLFVYGYVLSSMGHEHGGHDKMMMEEQQGGDSSHKEQEQTH